MPVPAGSPPNASSLRMKELTVCKTNPPFPPSGCSQWSLKSIVMISEMGRKWEVNILKLNWNPRQAANMWLSHQKMIMFAIYQHSRWLEWKSAEKQMTQFSFLENTGFQLPDSPVEIKGVQLQPGMES